MALGACSFVDWASYYDGPAVDAASDGPTSPDVTETASGRFCEGRPSAYFCSDFDNLSVPVHDGFRIPYLLGTGDIAGDLEELRSPPRSFLASTKEGPFGYAFTARPLPQDASFKVSFDLLMEKSGSFYSLLLAGIFFVPTLTESIDQDLHGYALSFEDFEHKTFGLMEINRVAGVPKTVMFLSLAGGEPGRWLHVELVYLARSTPELTATIDGVSGPSLPLDLSSGRIPLFEIGIISAESMDAGTSKIRYDNVVVETL